MRNRVFICVVGVKKIKVILDPVGVILSPLYISNIDLSNCVEEK